MKQSKWLRTIADSIEMQEAAGIAPIAKYAPSGEQWTFNNHLFEIIGHQDQWQLPRAVVEGRAVFLDDVLWYKSNHKPAYKVAITVDCTFASLPPGTWSWEEPKPSTVLVNGTELPLPNTDPERINYCFYVGNFSSRKDADKWQDKINSLLQGEE